MKVLNLEVTGVGFRAKTANPRGPCRYIIYIYVYVGVSQNWGYHFRGPHKKDYSVWGSMLGSPKFGKLPYIGLRYSVYLSRA